MESLKPIKCCLSGRGGESKGPRRAFWAVGEVSEQAWRCAVGAGGIEKPWSTACEEGWLGGDTVSFNKGHVAMQEGKIKLHRRMTMTIMTMMMN